MARKKSTHSRGGQPGNTNALKHGLYATALPTQYRRKLPPSTAGSVQAEIDLLRLLLANTLTGFAELAPSVPLPSRERLGEGGISINPERDGQSAPSGQSARSGYEASPDPFDDSVRFLNIATSATAAINRLIRLTNNPEAAQEAFWQELSQMADEIRQETMNEPPNL